ncbi:MAG: hypothetical protein V4662_16720 [Verrucomicrobiota bacterium]
MRTAAQNELVAVLKEARAWLSLPDNDFVWSGWEDANEALAELDLFIERVAANSVFDDLNLRVLFAVTGPIQETSLSSGWGREFCELAARFDQALAHYKASSIQP